MVKLLRLSERRGSHYPRDGFPERTRAHVFGSDPHPYPLEFDRDNRDTAGTRRDSFSRDVSRRRIFRRGGNIRGGFSPGAPTRQRQRAASFQELFTRSADQGEAMNALEKLSRAEAVIDLLRVNLAGDVCADLTSNAGLTLIEAKQDSGVALCELAEYLIAEARREIAAHFAHAVADALAPASLKNPRDGIPAAPAARARKKGSRKAESIPH